MPLIIQCPSCTRSLRVPDNLLGRLVKCPTCDTQFTATGEHAGPSPAEHGKTAGAPPPPGAAFTEQPPPPRRAAQPAEYDFRDLTDDPDDEYLEKEPRRRSWLTAHSAVAGPAIGLIVLGSIAIGISSLGLILNLMGVAQRGPMVRVGQRPQFGQEEAIISAVSGLAGAVLGLCWGGIVLSGALAMKNLKSHGYAMTGAIVAMLPCNGCCLLGLPFGIWALVVLSRSEVKEAFCH